MKKLSNISSQKIINQILRWGTQIIFIAAIAIMIYLSFVDNVNLDFNARKLTTIAAIGIVLNWIVWDSYYRKNYEALLQNDLENSDKGKYSIHRRYYYARKGWKDEDLRVIIRDYNRRFINTWKQDIEDICARTEEEIIAEGYKGYDHKFLIWRIKNHQYPKSGIRGPKDLLYLLSVGSADTLKFKGKAAEQFAAKGKITKVITSLLSVGLVASISVEFVQGSMATALMTLLLNIIMLFVSLFFGTVQGQKGAKIKLETVEEACELLEQWKNAKPVEEPYSEIKVEYVPEQISINELLVSTDNIKNSVNKNDSISEEKVIPIKQVESVKVEENETSVELI